MRDVSADIDPIHRTPPSLSEGLRRNAALRLLSVCADEEKDDPARLPALIAPGVPSTILHYGVSRPQVNLLAIIQFKPHLTGQHVLEVDGIGPMHSRVVGFQVGGEAG